MFKWLPSLSLGSLVLLTIAFGLVLGSGGYTFFYAEGFSYLSNDPTACINCHVMNDNYKGWQASSHGHVATCNDCHVPHNLVGKYLVKAENGWAHSKAMTLENYPEPIKMRDISKKVVLNNCVYCHGSMVSETEAHAGEMLDCLKCHRSAGHGARR